jgi:hypothetical protein
MANAVTIVPPGTNACVVPPNASVTSPAQTCPVPNLSPPSQTAAGALTQTATITIANGGTQPLTLSAPTVTFTNATGNISPSTAVIVPGGSSTNYTITLDPTAAGATGATVTFTTNDPSKSTLTVTVCGNAT